MQNASKKTCQNKEFKRPKQTFWMFMQPRNSKHAHWEHVGSLGSPSHHRIRPCTGRFWLAGVKGSGSVNSVDTESCSCAPSLPPQHPKTRQGQGQPDTGHPQAPSCIGLAGESHKPYLPGTMQAAEGREQNVLHVVLAGAELSTQF